MRERIVGIAIVRLAADERDRACDAIAFAAPDHRLARGGGAQIIDAEIERRLRAELAALEPEDRKSVVSGKSVSVRVDLGGRRTIKIKNEQLITSPSYVHNSTVL